MLFTSYPIINTNIIFKKKKTFCLSGKEYKRYRRSECFEQYVCHFRKKNACLTHKSTKFKVGLTFFKTYVTYNKYKIHYILIYIPL